MGYLPHFFTNFYQKMAIFAVATKKFCTFFQKPIDKYPKLCYNIIVIKRER